MGSTESKNEEKVIQEGGIHIQISRTQYYSGDIISGQILIDLSSSYQAKSLIIQLVGIEETQFQQVESQNDDSYDLSKKKIQRFGCNKFHDLKVQVYDFAQGNEKGRSLIGQWQLPFHIVIADHLPSSFHYEQSPNHKCSLKYTLKAYIEPIDQQIQQISVSQDIEVIQTINNLEYEPQQIEYSSTPVLCFCCLLGRIQMQAQIDKKYYDQLEEIKINVNCDASHSLSNVPNFIVKLQGRLIMKSNSKNYVEQTFDICRQTIPTKEQKINNQVKFRIPKSSKIGTQGYLIQYQNFIIIEPEISSIFSISSNTPLQLPFFINPQSPQISNLEKPQIIQMPLPNQPQSKFELPPQMNYPIMLNPQENQYQPNYNYPTETIVNKFQLQQIPQPKMDNQYSTVT